MPIRFISWNVDKFSATRAVNPNNRINKIVKLLNPAAGPDYDLFVLIEPRSGKTAPVDDVATGAGPRGIHELLTKLRARPNGANWRVTTPIVIYRGGFGETMAFFYDSSLLKWTGPDARQLAAVGAPWHHVSARRGTVHWLDTAPAPPLFRNTDLEGANPGQFNLGTNPGTVFVDLENERIYWEEAAAGEIWRCDLDGANSHQRVDHAHTGDPSGMIVDPVGSRIYWIDTGNHDICSSDLDGNGPAVIVDSAHAAHPNAHGGQPRDLAAGATHLYWVDDADNSIHLADLDGSNPDEAVSPAQAGDPRGLVFGNNKLYWADDASHDIKWADPDGSNDATVVPAATAGEPAGIVIAGGKLYWVNTAGGAANAILSADVNGANFAPLVSTAVAGTPVSLRVDTTANKITWLDTASSRVKWANLNGSMVDSCTAAGTPTDAAIEYDDVHDVRVRFQTAGAVPIVWRFNNIGESCPMLARFREVASGNEFYVLGVHCPAPTYGGNTNRQAQAAIAAIKTIDTVTAHPSPVIIAGDFNMCSHPNPTNAPECTGNDNDGHLQDRASIANFTAAPLAGGLGYQLTFSGIRTSLKKKAKWNKYTKHAYDHILSIGFTATANPAVVDLVVPRMDAWRVANGVGLGGPIPAASFRANNVYYKVRVTAGRGISDHLPVKADFTL